jgi:hypothetical protein
MSKLMLSLLGRLDNVPYHASEHALKQLLMEWRGDAEISLIRREIHHWLRESAVLEQVRTAARETSTHYVWPIYMGNNGYGLTINEFKDPGHMGFGYANVLHNHRYSFASLVLSGGYGQVRSKVEIPMSGRAVRIHDIAEDFVPEGCLLAINHDEFHRLTQFSNRTVTLLIKCPAVKKDSVSVDIETLRVNTHVPVEARLVQLMNALTTGKDIEMIEEKPHARLG